MKLKQLKFVWIACTSSLYSCLLPFFLDFFGFPGIQEIIVEFLVLTCTMTVNVFVMWCDSIVSFEVNF